MRWRLEFLYAEYKKLGPDLFELNYTKQSRKDIEHMIECINKYEGVVNTVSRKATLSEVNDVTYTRHLEAYKSAYGLK